MTASNDRTGRPAEGGRAGEYVDQLWRTYVADRDLATRAELLEQYLGLVHHVAHAVARQRFGVSLDYDDMVGAGTLGLVQALESFDPERGFAFSTYAVPRIRGAILDELRHLDWVPRSVREHGRRLREAREALSRELRREPTPSEIADALDIDLATYWRVHDQSQAPIVLPIASGGDADKRDGVTNVPDPAAPDQAAEVELDEALERMLEGFQSLPERDRLVLTLSFYERLTLKEIGATLHITESRVSQLRTRALRRLTERLNIEPEEEAA